MLENRTFGGLGGGIEAPYVEFQGTTGEFQETTGEFQRTTGELIFTYNLTCLKIEHFGGWGGLRPPMSNFKRQQQNLFSLI